MQLRTLHHVLYFLARLQPHAISLNFVSFVQITNLAKQHTNWLLRTRTCTNYLHKLKNELSSVYSTRKKRDSFRVILFHSDFSFYFFLRFTVVKTKGEFNHTAFYFMYYTIATQDLRSPR